MKCESCGGTIEIGSWPWCPDHSRPSPSKGFEPFFDIGLGEYVTGIGDINKACRPKWENDHIIRIQPRDKSAAYYRELNERREAKRHAQ